MGEYERLLRRMWALYRRRYFLKESYYKAKLKEYCERIQEVPEDE